MESPIIRGRGILLTGVTPLGIATFIKEHMAQFVGTDTEQRMFQQLALPRQSDEDIMRLFRNYKCMVSGNTGPGAAVSNIMRRESGLGFGFYKAGEDADDVILLEACMPYDYNRIERGLTKRALDNILGYYAKALGCPQEPVDIEFVPF